MITKKTKSTMLTIAKELGVSPSTVSRAFDPESKISDTARQKILQCAKRQDYVINRAASRLSMREIDIGVIYTGDYAPAANEYIKGINDAYRELYDLKINLEYEPLPYDDHIPEALSAALERRRGFDGVIVSGFTSPDEIKVLNAYAEHNKNIVLLQSDVKEIDKLFTSGHDPALSSRMAAEFMADCLRASPKKDVVIFTGERRSGLHFEANETFRAAAKEFGLNLIASYDMKDSPELLKRQTAELYEKQGLRPNGIYITSGKSVELCRYIKENDLAKDTLLITFDVYPELNKYLRDGVITATIYQNMYKQAKDAFVCLVRHIVGQSEVKSFISPAPVLVLRSNLAFYLR